MILSRMRRVNWQVIIICIVLGAMTMFAFRGAVDLPFVNYDDPGYVSENPIVSSGLSWSGIVWAFTHPHGGNWHPLTSISHMLDCTLFGLNAKWHHVINVLLHTASAILLFIGLRALTTSTWRSAIVTAIFATHPLRVESVAWISERKDVLSALFFMLVLIAYARYARRSTRSKYILVVVLFALGLMAKPMLVTLPLILCLLDFWPLGRGEDGLRRKVLIEKLPLFVMSFASGAVTLWAQAEALGSVDTMPLSWRLKNAVVSFFVYLRELVWPVDLTVFYPHQEDRIPMWQVTIGLIVIVGFSALVFHWRKRVPYLFVGWFWYLIMLLPVSGIIFVGMQSHADRYTYLPQIGLCLAIIWGSADLLGRQRVRRIALAGAALVIVPLLVWGTSRQMKYWNGSQVLWKHALEVTGDNDVAEVNLSEFLLRAKRDKEALAHCEAALRIRPENAQACNNLGLAYIHLGRVTEGVKYLRKSVSLRPNGANAALTLAWILATSPNPELRNGEEAVTLSARIAAMEQAHAPGALHTLAAAFAE
ncbi:MAG TPA: tetratricopeptide repeat protein, partial [Chthoniobacterales bacterium]|nr:tetratricopeptide repeat protein [Chthoniobacterales bacterium]